MTEEAVEIAITLQAGVPVAVKLVDVSRGLPLDKNQLGMFEAGPRSGYGGGHGIDATTLIHRSYSIP